jgi:predicted CopG family antitoxin
MKTIALNEKTFELISKLKEKEGASSFDKLILKLVLEAEGLSYSMRGSLKGKIKPFSVKERKEIWEDKKRWK